MHCWVTDTSWEFAPKTPECNKNLLIHSSSFRLVLSRYSIILISYTDSFRTVLLLSDNNKWEKAKAAGDWNLDTEKQIIDAYMYVMRIYMYFRMHISFPITVKMRYSSWMLIEFWMFNKLPITYELSWFYSTDTKQNSYLKLLHYYLF